NESDTTAGQDNLSLYERPSLSTEYVAPSTDEEKLLASIWQETLGINKIGVNDNFFELGGESLLGVKIVVKAKKMGLFLETKQMFATPTIAEIVKNLKKSNAVIADQSIIMGISPCSPIQQQFLNTPWTNKDHWNVGAVLNVTQTISETALKTTALCLLEQHDVLRSHFTRSEQGAWQQIYTPANSDRHVAWIDLSSTTDGAFSEQLQQHCKRLQSEMHIENGPLFKLAYFKAADPAHNKLALLFHHLVMDAISLGIVIEDLQTLLSADATIGKADMAKLLAAKTSSYKEFSTGLPLRVASLQADILYWQDAAEEIAKMSRKIPIDIAGGTNLEGDIASLSASLNVDLTQRLSQQVVKHTGLKVNELLLAVLAKTITDWLQQSHVIVDMVHHGRPDFDAMDFSRTVGWFGTGSPIPLKLAAVPLAAQLASLKSQIHSVPQQGLSLAWLKTLHSDQAVRAKLSQIPASAVSLNYIGQIDQLAAGGMSTATQDNIRALRDPSNQRLYQHDVIAYSQHGQITLNWNFSKKQYHEATIQGLLNNLMVNLQALANADWNAIQSSGSRHKISDATLQACGISADQIEECYGLTAFQSEIYRRYSDESKPLANVTQAVTVMEGPVDKKLLQAVWQALVARHKVLRTRFMHDVNGEPVQVVCKHADFALLELDYSHLDEAAQQQALMQLQVKDRLTRYDLSKAPALRLYWVMLSPQAGRFAIVMSNHQIILDGWTSSLLSKDLIICLMSMVSGKDLPAIQNQIEFGRYIDWLETQSIDDALIYWRKAFDGYRHAEPLQSLMSISSSITNAEDSYAESQLVIDDNLLNSVQETAKASQTTSNAVFQAAWALSLAQLSGGRDVVYGATVSGRSADFDGITEIIGQCTNSLPIRVPMSASMTVAQLLQAIHNANAQAQTHNLPSLKQIANAIGHDGNDSLYSSNFIFENIPRADSGEVSLPIKTISAVWTDGWQFPLRVFIVPEEKTWVRFAFDKSRFAIADIDELARRYQKNLIGLTKSIHVPVLQI
ncbi:MAG: condensation domain-containing protein, partial [Burkholderiaceae bacterium]